MSVHAIRQTALLKTTEWLCSRPKCQVLGRKGTPCLASSLLLHVNAGAPQLYCRDFFASAHIQKHLAVQISIGGEDIQHLLLQLLTLDAE